MENCSRYPNNPYCSCTNFKGESTPQYRQFNANSRTEGVGFNCCNKINYQPSYVAANSPGLIEPFTDVYSYINQFYVEDTRCDYLQFFGGFEGIEASLYLKNNYSDLYNYALKSMQIFNSFYCKGAYTNTKYFSSILNNSYLIPIIDGNNIKCPLGDFIPRILSYQDGIEAKDEYLYICYPDNIGYPNLQNTDYSILSIFDAQSKNSTKNTIDTQYGATNSNSVGGTIFNNKKKTLPPWEIALITISVILILTILGFILYKVIKKNKNRKDFI